MMSGRIRKRTDRFELRGWTYPFHEFQDSGRIARLEYETDEVQWLKLHGSNEPVEIRPGDLDIILPQIGYPVPTAKKRKPGEERMVETIVEVEVPIDNPSDKQEIERLRAELRDAEARAQSEAKRADEAEQAANAKDKLDFSMDGEGGDFDRLRDMELPSDLAEEFAALVDDLEDLRKRETRKKLWATLNEEYGLLRRERAATKTFDPREDTVNRMLAFLGRTGASSV